jgi:uncharacterized protein YecE (DUF72 family)
VAERRSVAADVVGSNPTSRPNFPSTAPIVTSRSQSGSRPASKDKPTPAPGAGPVYLGTSGWAYATWKPGFYPADVSQKKFLAYYGSQLNSVEVNYTFRALPTAAMCENWLAATPADFRFSFKAAQRITHFQRLRESESTVREFIAALAPFREAGKLGLVLFQLPPNFKADVPRLTEFLAMLQAVPDVPPAAFEFRHDSWFCEETYAALRAHGCALCIAESDELATPEIYTAPHIAYRLRRTDYSGAEIAALAVKFRTLAAAHTVYAYFKHEDEPDGALRAVALRAAIASGSTKAKRAQGSS